jgi:regulator of replication initiation timing
MDPSVILQQFCNKGDDESKSQLSTLLESNWREMERLVRAAVRDTTTEDSKSLSQTLHQLTVQNKVLKHENSSLREALAAKKKRKTCYFLVAA